MTKCFWDSDIHDHARCAQMAKPETRDLKPETSEEALIGFGSNQGDSARICLEAIQALRKTPGIRVLKVSSLYHTEPVGMLEQEAFVNGVVLCETSLSPEDLLRVTRGIEGDFGRVRDSRWGPRTLDLDILSFGDRRMDSIELTIPHPRIPERRFVLVPLVEIMPRWIHPVLRRTARELLERLANRTDQKVERLEV